MTKQEFMQVAQWIVDDVCEYNYTCLGWQKFRGAISICEPYFSYRTSQKPTPKLRPWKPEEVPVGSLIRPTIDKRCKGMITDFFPNSDLVGITGANTAHPSYVINTKDEAGSGYTRELMLEFYEYSIDLGKTWLPCGVME